MHRSFYSNDSYAAQSGAIPLDTVNLHVRRSAIRTRVLMRDLIRGQCTPSNKYQQVSSSLVETIVECLPLSPFKFGMPILVPKGSSTPGVPLMVPAAVRWKVVLQTNDIRLELIVRTSAL